MGKGKKKRKIDQVSHLTNLTGFRGLDNGDASSSMDDCMAEMMRQQQPAADTETTASVAKKASASSPSSTNHQPSWTRQSSYMSSAEIKTWNQSFIQWTADHHYIPGLLPNIDEEIARNFKVKELSTLLLKRFKDRDLRMPVFERWLLDSKLEESQQKVASTEREPVLPLHATPDSPASQ